MLKRKNRLIVVFSSLKEGKHSFEFEVTPEFFQGFDHSLIQSANVQVEIEMEKKSNMLELDFYMNGNVTAECARCTDEISVPVAGEEHLVVKFGNPQEELNDDILWLDENAYEIDLSQQIYEYIHLLLPVRNIHPQQKDCNPVVMQKLEELRVREEAKDIDPRWEELKKLRKE